MNLQDLTHEVGRKLEHWHDDLREVSRMLEDARGSFLHVDDESTGQKFYHDFEEFKKVVDELNRDVSGFANKIDEFEKEVKNSSAKKD